MTEAPPQPDCCQSCGRATFNLRHESHDGASAWVCIDLHGCTGIRGYALRQGASAA